MLHTRVYAKHFTANGLTQSWGLDLPTINIIVTEPCLGLGNIMFISSEAGIYSQLILTPKSKK